MLLAWETAAGPVVASCGYRVTLGSWGLSLEESKRTIKVIIRSVDIVGIARGRPEVRGFLVFKEIWITISM